MDKANKKDQQIRDILYEFYETIKAYEGLQKLVFPYREIERAQIKIKKVYEK